MRVLRSQYLKCQAQQDLHSVTRQITTSELNVAANGICVRQTRSQTIRMRLAAEQAFDKNNNNYSSISKDRNLATKNYARNYNKSSNSGNKNVKTTNLSVPLVDNALNALTQSAYATVEPDLLTSQGSVSEATLSGSTSTTTTSTICCTIKPKMFVQDDSSGSLAGASSKRADLMKRRQTVDCGQQLKIQLHNVPTDNYSRINLVVRFYDEGPLWYTRFYRGYQDVLWVKLPRFENSRYKKWFYECRVCKRQLCSFKTLKWHLNIHMRFYPYQCDICIKCYAGQPTLRSHNRLKHRNNRKTELKKLCQ